MKIRISHFDAKNIQISELTKPTIKSVFKDSNITNTNRKRLSSVNIRLSLAQKLGVNSNLKAGNVSSKKIIKEKRESVVKTEKQSRVGNSERTFYKENAKYAYTPEIHNQLHRLHCLEKILSNKN